MQEVKRATDSFIGTPSQCFVSSKAGVANAGKLRGRQQYTANLAMKINAKLGGTNVALGERALPTWTRQSDFMVFGAPPFTAALTDHNPYFEKPAHPHMTLAQVPAAVQYQI